MDFDHFILLVIIDLSPYLHTIDCIKLYYITQRYDLNIYVNLL